jgi:tRNA1(Val) A37 N6-methylase TrmN6
MPNYLRRQAEVLLSMSRATLDLGIAGRLRAMAAEFHAKAAELQEDGPFENFEPVLSNPPYHRQG